MLLLTILYLKYAKSDEIFCTLQILTLEKYAKVDPLLIYREIIFRIY
jgi:hypothetical protein